MTLPAGMEQRKRERISPALAESDRSRLSFELDGNYFKWFVTEAFRQVGEGVHVLHRPGACLDVLCPPVRVREFSMDVRQEDGNGLRVEAWTASPSPYQVCGESKPFGVSSGNSALRRLLRARRST